MTTSKIIAYRLPTVNHAQRWTSDMADFYHRPVLLDEVLAGLDIKDGGLYFDGTAGGGGHSVAILASNPTVKLIATDRDAEAIQAAGENGILRGCSPP